MDVAMDAAKPEAQEAVQLQYPQLEEAAKQRLAQEAEDWGSGGSGAGDDWWYWKRMGNWATGQQEHMDSTSRQIFRQIIDQNGVIRCN